MKKMILFTLTILVCLTAVSVVSGQIGLYPIGGGNSPSYPGPNYQSPSQPGPYQPGPYQPGPNQPNQPGPVQQQNNCPQPYFDYNTGYWVQPICYDQTQPYYPQPYNPQPTTPEKRDGNVKVSRQGSHRGGIALTMEIRNVTAESWSKSSYDIKCVSGCYLLENPRQTLWDIPYTVNRNETLTFTVNISQHPRNETMTFAIVAGSKTIYTFTVTP